MMDMLWVTAHGKQFKEHARYCELTGKTNSKAQKTGDELVDEFFGHMNKIAPV